MTAVPATPLRRTQPGPVHDARALASIEAPRTPDAGPWLLAARADAVDVETRAAFAEALRGLAPPEGGWIRLDTCHRVELFGMSSAPNVVELAREVAGLRLLEGEDAIGHLLRLSAGLESAVLGEDQILHQIRTSLRHAQARGGLDPRLNRLIQLAIGVGRKARAGWQPAERSLADRALAHLESLVGPIADRDVLVAGAGEMGVTLVRAATARGARVTVASRDLEHARRVARQYGTQAVDLAAAARLAPAAAVLAVALGGRWTELDPFADHLPPTVDLSSPSALSPAVRAALGAGFTGIDDLFVHAVDEPAASIEAPAPGAAPPAGSSRSRSAVAPSDTEAFVARAEGLVAEATRAYQVWLAGRRAVETIRALRERAEARRRDELDRLLRRLPDLDPRERELVAALSSQLVAAILHEPLARLREDHDGTGTEAARHLFGL